MEIIKIINSPLTYIVVSAIILVILHKESNYINVIGICKKYIKFLTAEKQTLKIVCIIVIIPILLAISTTLIKKVEAEILNNTMVVVSIIMSMLFTVLALIKDKTIIANDKTHFEAVTIEEVKNETISIIHYLVLLNILIILIAFIFPIIPVGYKKIFFVGNVIFYSLLYHDFFNILIVVKRYSKLV